MNLGSRLHREDWPLLGLSALVLLRYRRQLLLAQQVERWFALLTSKHIRRGVHKNVQALERDIRTWIKTWNEDPKPFVWTKTAAEIFERLAGYLNRIYDSGHWAPQQAGGTSAGT